MTSLPYCGAPPDPGELLSRFNLDPVLIVALALLAGAHLRWLGRAGHPWRAAAAGWGLAAFALLSPLCALSVSLFSARIGQHMLLALVAAPLIALGLPRRGDPSGRVIAANAAAFAVALWFWHMPGPYLATFRSDWVYWTMHITLSGSALLLWRDLVQHRAAGGLGVLAAGAATSVQMGLLGAILTFATVPLFPVHFATAPVWGFSPLGDQQLGGLLMWVPGMLFFLIAAKRSLDIVLVRDVDAARG